ncbi:MAG: hypothetical protein QM775_11790 [Pirellulales bacterium]
MVLRIADAAPVQVIQSALTKPMNVTEPIVAALGSGYQASVTREPFNLGKDGKWTVAC